MQTETPRHPVVTPAAWLEARKELYVREKELTREHDAVAKLRQSLPWVKLEKAYVFEGAEGLVSLSDLFEGRSQLIVQHYMFGPDWEEGCVGCSFLSDHVDAARQHFERHDVSFAAVSRAPFEKLEMFRRRMGWNFRWVSSLESDFNFDFHVSQTQEEKARGRMFFNFRDQPVSGSEQDGISSFYKNRDGEIFHCYSAFERGIEAMIGAYAYLDIAPLGRNEEGGLGEWVKLHDRYEEPTIALAEPRIIDSKALIFAGPERGYRFDAREDLPKQWFEFGHYLGSVPAQVGGDCYGISSHMYDGGQAFRYMTGIEVSEVAGLPDEFSAIRMPARRYAVFSHLGHISRICETICAIFSKWQRESEYEVATGGEVIERYGASFDPVSGFGEMEIWVPLA